MMFIRYLKEQIDRDDQVGDFARDVLRTPHRPRGAAGYMAWNDFVTELNFSFLAKRALRQAWGEYKSHNK